MTFRNEEIMDDPPPATHEETLEDNSNGSASKVEDANSDCIKNVEEVQLVEHSAVDDGDAATDHHLLVHNETSSQQTDGVTKENVVDVESPNNTSTATDSAPTVDDADDITDSVSGKDVHTHDDCKQAIEQLNYVIFAFDSTIGDFKEIVLEQQTTDEGSNNEPCETPVHHCTETNTNAHDAAENTSADISIPHNSANNVSSVTGPETETDSNNPVGISEVGISEHDPSNDDDTMNDPDLEPCDSVSLTYSENGAGVDPSAHAHSEKKKKKSFPVNPEINITLKYCEGNTEVLGNIRSVKGLGLSKGDEENICHAPQFVQFHITVLPQDNYRLATKWVTASTKSLAWNFKIGPFVKDFDSTKKNIRFRLYGKSKSGATRCYGECFVVLSEVVESETSVEFIETLLPKGTLKNKNAKCRTSGGKRIKGR